jgi:hypothetical protein
MWSVAVASFALATTLMAGTARADLLREWGVRAAGGVSDATAIQYYAVHPFVGFRLWQGADQWLEEHHLELRWVIEPWVAFVRDPRGPNKTESFEIGANLLFLRLYIADWKVRPFIEGGEGVLYTDLRKQGLGSRFQFSNQIGGGVEWAIRPDMSLAASVRWRHISNGDLYEHNAGLNHIIGFLGLTFR